MAAAEAARRVAERLCLAFPTGGALEAAVRERFGAAAEIIDVPEPKLTYGSKNWRDFVRMAAHSAAMVMRQMGLARRSRLLYANGAREFPPVMLLSLLARRRACYHIHIDHSRVEKRLIALAARLPTTARIVVNSPFIYRRLIAARPELTGNTKVVVVENGLAPHFAGMPFVDRFGLTPDPFHIAVLGVIRPEKGQDAALELARREPRVHVHLIGRTGEGAETWAARLRAAAPDNVTFHGAVADVPGKLATIGAHVNLVAPRWEEPFGMVAIEGMACSCITVVRACGALPDIAAKTGAIVYGDDVNALAAAVRRLRETLPAELTALARRQYEATMALYNPELFLRKLAGVLTSAMDAGRPHANRNEGF
jgi:glycosyltransferase involved in cell wall biosynthesis